MDEPDSIDTRALSGARLGKALDGELVGIYLGDHLTGAAAGLSRIRHMAAAHRSESYGPDLARLAREVSQEHDVQRNLLDALGLGTHRVRRALAWSAERLGMLKLNGRVFSRSPMTPLLELELVRSAVAGKRAGWQVLAEIAPDLGLPREPFEAFAVRSLHQIEMLEAVHAQVRVTALRRARPR